MTLTLQELRSLVDAGKVSSTEFSLSLAALGSPSVSALAKYLAGGALALGVVDIEQSDTEKTVTVTGTASSGCFTGCTVTAVFGIAGGQATLSLTATTPQGWGLATAFPVLAHCAVASLRFGAAKFVVSSTESGGLATFRATLAVSSFLGPLASLFGGSGPELTGQVDVVTGMPSFALTTQPAQIDLGFAKPLAVTFEVHADPFTTTIGTEDDPPVTTSVADVRTPMVFRATLPFSVRGQQYVLPVVATVVDPATQVTFRVDLTSFTEAIEAGLADLVELTAGTAVGAPPSVAGLDLAELVTLRDVEFRINPSAQRKLVSVSLEVANSGTWVILPPDAPGGGLAVDDLILRIDVDMATHQPAFAIITEIDVGLGAPLQLSAFAPDFALIGGLRPGTEVKLSDVVTRFAPADVSGFPDLDIAGLGFSVQPGTAYSIDVDVHGDWPIPLGFTDLSITKLQLTADYVSGPGVTGSLSGTFTIDDVDVALSAAHPGSGQWVFTADAATTTPVDLASIVDGLLPDQITLPSQLSGLQVRSLTASWDTGPAKHFTFGGETDLAVTVGPRSLTTTTTLSVDSLLAVGNQRKTTGRLSGTLVLDAMTFTASYAFQPGVQVLVATWSGQGVDLTALAGTFGITMPALEVDLPVLGLHTASFELDWSKAGQESVTFEATTEFGAAFFALARPQPQAPWGFVFGASLDGANRLSDLFGHVGLDGTGLDFVKLDGAMFLVASTSFPKFHVTGFPLLGSSPRPVNAGVSAGVLLNLGESTSRPDVDALRALTSGQAATLFAEVTLGTSLTALAVTARLAGDLTLKGAGTSSLTLSNVAVVLKVEPLALTLRGSIEVPVGEVTMLATGTLTVAENGSLTAAFNIEGENGQVLPFPMGLPGVHLLDLGVVLGVAIEPPSVELGFEGKFVVGATDPQPTRQAVAPRPLTGMPPADEFVMIIALDGEIPNPVLLSMFLQELSMGKAVEAFTDQPATGLPGVLTEISASDLMIYWCDAVQGVKLPDGTWAYAGFGFNCILDLAGFHAYAALKVSQATGITGDACIDPVHLNGVLDLTGTGIGTPATYAGEKTVLPGGPFVHVSTAASPYLDIDWDLVLFNTVSETLNAKLTTSGFTFETAYKVGDVFSENLKCSLKNWTRFELGFTSDLKLDVPIGAVAGVDLGPIHLDTSFSGNVVVEVSDGFSMTTTGTFMFEDSRFTLPKITSSVPFASLDAIPEAVADQIQDNADTIFKSMIDEAAEIIKQGKIEAESIKQQATTAVAEYAKTTDQMISKIITDAETDATAIRAAIDNAATEAIAAADAIFEQAQRDAATAQEMFEAAWNNVQHVAAAAHSEAATIASEAVDEARSVLHTVVNEAGDVFNDATDAITDAWNQFTHLF